VVRTPAMPSILFRAGLIREAPPFEVHAALYERRNTSPPRRRKRLETAAK
jgi:hypothetical protein